ncbi:MAG: DUF4160 domain-containing protein [bacterium]
MPTVLRIGPFRFHFYSDESKEPAHIHVRSPDGECKFGTRRISSEPRDCTSRRSGGGVPGV